MTTGLFAETSSRWRRLSRSVGRKIGSKPQAISGLSAGSDASARFSPAITAAMSARPSHFRPAGSMRS